MQLMLHASVICHHTFFDQGPEEAGMGSVYSGTGFQVPGKLQARTLLPLSDDANLETDFLLMGS